MKNNMKTFLRSTALGTSALCLASGMAFADQVFLDDVIIDGSLCVGFDCVNGESFGFDTLRLKENNLRLHFDDTSTAAAFPSADWRLVANDSSNGGENKFALEDVGTGRQTFTVEQGARANALFVESTGDVGFGTSNPVVVIHAADGDTPTMRLEQDGSSGWNPQTWDVAGNETNFFIRDVTNGSKLPFRIRPNAPTSALELGTGAAVINDGGGDYDFRVEGDDDDGLFFVDASQGRVAIGVPNQTPLSKLDVRDNTGTGPEQMLRLVNNGAPQLFMRNSASNRNWLFSAGASMLLSPSDNPADAVFDLSNTGNLTIDGTLTESSDKHRKMAIEPVDAREILAKVRAMPVAEWTYKHDAETGIRHIGPMAQDFYAAFGTGADEKGISSLDGTGVALAAIQALSAENSELRAGLIAENSELRTRLSVENGELRMRLEALEIQSQSD